jgi:hypothetical protein
VATGGTANVTLYRAPAMHASDSNRTGELADARPSTGMRDAINHNVPIMYADSLICSHPRSGGRWLRFLVAHYLGSRHHLRPAVTPETVFGVVPDHHPSSERGYPAAAERDRQVPLLAVCHEPYTWDRHRGFPVIFLARNAYDVVVSAYYHLTEGKRTFSGSMMEFLHHPRMGLPTWIAYMNSWAPKLLTHRDVTFLAYGELGRDPAGVLERVLAFIDEEPDPLLVAGAVAQAQRLRDSRLIRTGQEGNFWDHLQPEEIFDIQELLQVGLSDVSRHLLQAIGIELDPFPRVDS